MLGDTSYTNRKYYTKYFIKRKTPVAKTAPLSSVDGWRTGVNELNGRRKNNALIVMIHQKLKSRNDW